MRYQHTDALGTPIATTDASKNVVDQFEYEPYGQLVNATLRDGPGYTGHVQDAATGLTYMQERYYDPGIGRFLSVDPVTVLSSPVGMFNRYKYAANNPYKFTDPDGRCEAPIGTRICHPNVANSVRSSGPVGDVSSQGGGSKQTNQAPQAGAGQVGQKIDSATAWNHYKGGSGTPLRMNFGDVDTSGVKATDFPQVRALVSSEKNGDFTIDSRSPFSTSGDQAIFLGNITLRAQGALSLDAGSYSFKGTLKSFDDFYDFNKSTHRGVIGELLTRFGGTQEGTPYWIEIRGAKSIEETGSR